MKSPPVSIEPMLRTYLQEELSRLNSLVLNSEQLKKETAIPTKPVEGKIYYFPSALTAPITAAGFWGYSSSGWVQLG